MWTAFAISATDVPLYPCAANKARAADLIDSRVETIATAP